MRDSSLAVEQQISVLIGSIPEPERAAFDAYYQARLHAAMQAANRRATMRGLEADPDRVEADVVEHLIREAEGRDHPDGLGSVPYNGKLYELVPPDSDPRLTVKKVKEQGAQMTRGRWIGIGVLSLVVLLGLIWSMGGKPAAIARTAGGTPTVTTTATVAPNATPTALAETDAGSDITVAFPASLEITHGTTTDVYRVSASASTLGGTWEPELSQGVAVWLKNTFINHVFCVPDTASLLTTLERGDVIVMRPASGAVRRYAVLRRRSVGRQHTEVLDQQRAGLTLLGCGAAGNQRTVIEATYRPETVTTTTGRPGQAVLLPDIAHVTLESVTLNAPTTSDPAGYTTLVLVATVKNLTTAPLARSDLADQFERDGQVVERIASDAEAVPADSTRRMTFRYRVPVQGGAGTWQLTSPTGDTISIAANVAPAPQNAQHQPYRAQIDQSSIKLRDTDRTLAFDVVLTATLDQDTTIQPDDVTVWLTSRSLPLLPESSALPVTLTPGRATRLTLMVHLPDVSQFDLQIGTQRWRVTLP